jgi:hypothetical protein
MGAAGVSPAERECTLVNGPFLQKQLVAVVEEENTKGPMRKGIGVGKITIRMSSPLVDRGSELVILVD